MNLTRRELLVILWIALVTETVDSMLMHIFYYSELSQFLIDLF